MAILRWPDVGQHLYDRDAHLGLQPREPHRLETDSMKIYVGNLSFRTTQQELEDLQSDLKKAEEKVKRDIGL